MRSKPNPDAKTSPIRYVPHACPQSKTGHCQKPPCGPAASWWPWPMPWTCGWRPIPAARLLQLPASPAVGGGAPDDALAAHELRPQATQPLPGRAGRARRPGCPGAGGPKCVCRYRDITNAMVDGVQSSTMCCMIPANHVFALGAAAGVLSARCQNRRAGPAASAWAKATMYACVPQGAASRPWRPVCRHYYTSAGPTLR